MTASLKDTDISAVTKVGKAIGFETLLISCHRQAFNSGTAVLQLSELVALRNVQADTRAANHRRKEEPRHLQQVESVGMAAHRPPCLVPSFDMHLDNDPGEHTLYNATAAPQSPVNGKQLTQVLFTGGLALPASVPNMVLQAFAKSESESRLQLVHKQCLDQPEIAYITIVKRGLWWRTSEESFETWNL